MPVVEQPSSALVHILAIEDNPEDVELMRVALNYARFPFLLDVIGDGDYAISHLQRMEEEPGRALPDIILLDLNLPCCDGIEVLRAIRGCVPLEAIPVAVLTSSDSPKDRVRAAAAGANRYMVKPHRLEDYDRLIATIGELCPRKASA